MNALEMFLEPLMKKYGFDPASLKKQITDIQQAAMNMDKRMTRIEIMCERLLIDRGLSMPQGYSDKDLHPDRLSASEKVM